MSFLPEPDVPCAECGRMLRWFVGRGWGHVQGTGSTWFGCHGCYEQRAWYPVPDSCPTCGGKLLDLHQASPATAKRSTA